MSTAPRPQTAADRPMTWRSCFVGALIWLCVINLPCLGVWLAMQGEINWQRGAFDGDRIWLVNEGAPTPQQGLAWAATRIERDELANGGPLHVRSHVTFFLWQGQGENANYCEVYAHGADGQLAYVGACP